MKKTKKDYPSQYDLNWLKRYEVQKNNIDEFLEALRMLWYLDEWGFKLKKTRNYYYLFLSTAGWSGNEDIIEALRKNFFWALFWQESKRGGHYKFKINLKSLI